MKLSNNSNILDQIIFFTKANEKLIRAEFDKMAEFYSNDREKFLDALLDVKHDIKNEDYLSDLITKNLEDKLKNFDSVGFSFNEEYLMTSLEKAYAQYRRVPMEILKHNDEIKILFYDLLEEPDKNGLRLIMSRLITNWRALQEYYSSKYN